MKFKHLLVILTSAFLPACGNNDPSNSENLNKSTVDEDSKVSFDDNTTNIPPEEIRYSVSGYNGERTSLVTDISLDNQSEEFTNDESYPPINDIDSNKISTFSTKVYTKTADRVKNLRIVCDRLSGTILEPNEEFSYNDTCGPYNKENGFGKATVFINGKEAQEYGGGVCQLSSTLYNAVKKVGVEILERHNHSNDVYYVPINEDATVSYGSLDFRFKNTNSFPIEIQAFSDSNEVTVSIYKI